jgi:hypothetical protein
LSTHGLPQHNFYKGARMIAALTVLSLMTLLVIVDTTGGHDGAR